MGSKGPFEQLSGSLVGGSQQPSTCCNASPLDRGEVGTISYPIEGAGVQGGRNIITELEPDQAAGARLTFPGLPQLIIGKQF